jgi:hypothetical protein
MTSPTARQAAQALAAVVLGNAVYFLLLVPRLPASWQHQPFAFDRGLALDFALCLGFYLLVRRLALRRRT